MLYCACVNWFPNYYTSVTKQLITQHQFSVVCYQLISLIYRWPCEPLSQIQVYSTGYDSSLPRCFSIYIYKYNISYLSIYLYSRIGQVVGRQPVIVKLAGHSPNTFNLFCRRVNSWQRENWIYLETMIKWHLVSVKEAQLLIQVLSEIFNCLCDNITRIISWEMPKGEKSDLLATSCDTRWPAGVSFRDVSWVFNREGGGIKIY